MNKLNFIREQHDQSLKKIHGSPDCQFAFWVIDEFLFDRMPYAEAINRLSRMDLHLDNLELIAFLDVYKEYKTLDKLP